jgi:Ca2+-dependent lipid-binding protein
MEYKTKTINNTTDPEWNEVFEFAVEQYESDYVEFEIFDEDPGKDDFIGRAQFPLSDLVDKDAVDTWLTLKDVKKGSLNVCLQYFALTTNKSALDIMEKLNNQFMNRDKLSKALLVCFIDRCTNLPRSKRTRREPNPFCRIKVEASEIKTQTFESQTNPQFEHVSQILCKSPLHEKLRIDVCDARSNNEVIAFFELPIKQIYNTETMRIESQAFQLKSLSEPLDNATIVLRLSLFILSPGRANESRLTPPPRSPTTNSNQSFDGLSTSATIITSDMKRSIVKELSLQVSPVEDHENKTESLGAQRQPSSPGVHSILENRLSPDRKNIAISDDPDLKSVHYGQIKLGIRYAATRKSLSVTVYACKKLVNVHEHNLPDPYVRVYLMPDFKKDKKKTKSIHDTLNPVFDDLFEWPATLNDIHRQRLYLSIKNNSPLFAQEQTYMGDLQIDLSNLDPEKTSIAWYALQEPNTSGGGIIKIKYDTFESNEQNTQL